MELDERKAAILRAIVEEHITTAQPVGSQTIARSRGLGVSSATVRNDMTVLEREGYLVQPHTSAGRVPTDRGYRFFVDNFERQPGLAPAQRRVVSDFFTLFASAHQVLEDLLHETSQLLARVSTHTAVVVGPHHVDVATVRSVQLVNLQPSLVLALAILSNGNVEKSVLHVSLDTDDATIATAGALLDTQLSGSPWVALPELRPVAGPAADTLAREARDTLAFACAAGGRRAALRGWRQSPRRRPGGVPHQHERGPAARAARTAGRGGLAGARPPRPGPDRAHRIGEPDRRVARLLDRRGAVPRRR